MRIQFDYAWTDASQRVMRYAARDNWTWKDFHAVVHVSQFAISQAEGPVHVWIDFSTGHRDRFPAGLAAHARTFNKRYTDPLSGQVVVTGVPQPALVKIGVSVGTPLTTPDGDIYFVPSAAAAEAKLASWA